MCVNYAPEQTQFDLMLLYFQNINQQCIDSRNKEETIACPAAQERVAVLSSFSSLLGPFVRQRSDPVAKIGQGVIIRIMCAVSFQKDNAWLRLVLVGCAGNAYFVYFPRFVSALMLPRARLD